MGKKGKRSDDGYANMTFSSIASTGRPGTPHRFFNTSYKVLHNQSVDPLDGTSAEGTVVERKEASTTDSVLQDLPPSQVQVVHRHVNGLCIVTAGMAIKEMAEKAGGVRTICFKQLSSVDNTPSDEQHIKKLKANVTPRFKIADVVFNDGSVFDILCCVKGQIIELNNKLLDCPSLLVDDPLLDGWIAIIMPSGKFPPSP